MNYQLIALDMDGTILNSQNRITKNTTHAIRKCIQKGIKVVLASGRLSHSMDQLTTHLGLVDEQISVNGAVVSSNVTQNKLYEFVIPKNEYLDILSKLQPLNLPLLVFCTDKYYTRSHTKHLDRIEKASCMKAEKISDFSAIENPTKILTLLDSPEDVDTIVKCINNPNYTVIRTGQKHVEIVRTDVNKGAALKLIAKEYNIPQDKILAIGDSENDIDMIEYAGMGIAMGNAYEHVKKISNDVTDTCDNDGVAKALYQYVLNS